MRALESVFGRTPPGLSQLLDALVKPDVINATASYLYAHDVNRACRLYEAPWDCLKESEARWENVREHNQITSGGMMEFDYWCENCRVRITRR